MLYIFLTVLFYALFAVNFLLLATFLLPEKKYKTNFCPPVSVIIPAHNEEENIEATLNSVLKSKYKNKMEIIVVNDGSTDRTDDIVRRMSKKNRKIRLVKIKHSGKSAAINRGLRKAKYGVTVFLDADSSLDEKSLSELVRPLADKNTAISSGIIRGKHTRNPLTWLQDIEYVASSAWRYACDKIGATYIAPGFAAIKKGCILKVGGFSGDTLTEDIDTTITLRKAGYGSAMSKAVIFTSVPSSFRKLFRQRIRWGRGAMQTARKHSDILFSKKSGAVGFYSFPVHLFWYPFALLYLPLAIYWISTTYLSAGISFFSLSSVVFFIKWLTLYGIFDMFYNVINGTYAFTPLIASVALSWIFSFAYIVFAMKKFSALSWKYAFYAVMFPYYWLIFLLQAGVFVYEIIFREKGSNVWDKF